MVSPYGVGVPALSRRTGAELTFSLSARGLHFLPCCGRCVLVFSVVEEELLKGGAGALAGSIKLFQQRFSACVCFFPVHCELEVGAGSLDNESVSQALFLRLRGGPQHPRSLGTCSAHSEFVPQSPAFACSSARTDLQARSLPRHPCAHPRSVSPGGGAGSAETKPSGSLTRFCFPDEPARPESAMSNAEARAL